MSLRAFRRYSIIKELFESNKLIHSLFNDHTRSQNQIFYMITKYVYRFFKGNYHKFNNSQ